MPKTHKYRLAILIPCLNEAETIGIVIRKALSSIQKSGLKGYVLVADNGSSDLSREIAIECGASVIKVEKKGYGSALLEGIKLANSDFIVMVDADDSYAIDKIQAFIDELGSGADLVMGNRFKGGIEEGAMPWLHRYLGNPILSFIGRILFQVKIGDFHCGLRAFKKDSIDNLDLRCSGMEFASEMVVKSALGGLKISEVPTTLQKDGRSRKPHLNTWRDGWRHLVFLLAASPRWLFLYPSLVIVLMGISLLALALSTKNSLPLNNSILIFQSGAGFLISGTQLLLTSILVRIFGYHHGFLRKSKRTDFFEKLFSLERGILISLTSVLISFFLYFVYLSSLWPTLFSFTSGGDGFIIITLATLTFMIGLQILFASFFASIIQSS